MEDLNIPVAWRYTNIESGHVAVSLECPELAAAWNDLDLFHIEPLYLREVALVRRVPRGVEGPDHQTFSQQTPTSSREDK